MIWVEKPPKRDGFYLHKYTKDDFPTLIPVRMSLGIPMYCGGHYNTTLNERGYWLGPVCPLYKPKVKS